MAKAAKKPNSTLVEDIPVAAIRASPLNRVVDENDPAVKSLAQSMREGGLIQPIVVRKAGRHYEIVCGERRWAAAKHLEWETIPAINRGTISTKDAHVLRLTENLQRADVPPLEQAVGVAVLLEVLGNVEEVARRLGQSEEWVRLRARLQNLSDTWRNEIKDPQTPYPLLASFVTWQEAIARLPHEAQEQLWQSRALLHATTLEEVKTRIQRVLRLISTAPFPTTTRGKVTSSCATCKKRSDHADQYGLFRDITPPDREGDGYCLDPVCWRKKNLKAIQKEIHTLHRNNPDAVFLVNYANRALVPELKPDDMDVLEGWWISGKNDEADVAAGNIETYTGCLVERMGEDWSLSTVTVCAARKEEDEGTSGATPDKDAENCAAYNRAQSVGAEVHAARLARRKAQVELALDNARTHQFPKPEHFPRLLLAMLNPSPDGSIGSEWLPALQADVDALSESIRRVLADGLAGYCGGTSSPDMDAVLPYFGVDTSEDETQEG